MFGKQNNGYLTIIGESGHTTNSTCMLHTTITLTCNTPDMRLLNSSFIFLTTLGLLAEAKYFLLNTYINRGMA